MKFSTEHYDWDKILFVNLDAVYDMHGIVQKWHSPEKHGAVLCPEQPYEGGMTLPVAVYPTADGERLRCQYTCMNEAAMYPDLERDQSLHVNGIAESTDGVHWERIRVGEVEFRGSTDNNILPGNPDAELKVIMDPRDPDPARRYKAIALVWPGSVKAIETSRKGRFFCSYTSSDGIHWSAPTTMPGFEETGDTSGLTYDERRGLYVVTTRPRGYWLSDDYPPFSSRPIKKGVPDGRWVAVSTSPDFVSWTPLDPIMVRDAADEQGIDFYCGLPFPYGNVYLGWLRRHHFWHGTMDSELLWSHDALRWQRSWTRKAFLEPGELGGVDWSYGDVLNVKPVRLGDRLLIYYEGRNHVHGPHNLRKRRNGRGYLGMDAVLGLSTMRLDGFVSLEAGRMGGELVTELLPFRPTMSINARTVAGGLIAVDLLDADGRPMSDREILFEGDDCRFALDLAGLLDAAPSPDTPVRLRFYLENAALYSLSPHTEPKPI